MGRSAILTIQDDAGRDGWALGPNGNPIVFDETTGVGAECCCGGGGGQNPCCLIVNWRRCNGGAVVNVPNFGSEAIYALDFTRTTHVDRDGNIYDDTHTYRERTRYFGVLQTNGQCWFFQQCVEFFSRIVRVWQQGQGHTSGDVEVIENITQCANPNPSRLPSATIGGSCYNSVQTGGNWVCNGSFGSMFQTLWSWNIQCVDTGNPLFSATGTEGIRVVQGASVVELTSIQYTKSLVPTQPCGTGSLTGPGASGVPIEAGIAEFLRRQAGCAGCGG